MARFPVLSLVKLISSYGWSWWNYIVQLLSPQILCERSESSAQSARSFYCTVDGFPHGQPHICQAWVLTEQHASPTARYLSKLVNIQ